MTEIYEDGNGNSVSIIEADDGVTVSAQIKSLPPYAGGSNADAARAYAKKHKMKKR